MSSGERPIGADKGKQHHTEALCQPPTLLPARGGGGGGALEPELCRPAGGGRGLLSLGFTRQVQPSGGGTPNPPQPHLRARMGERTTRAVGRVAPRKMPCRMEAQVLLSRRDTLGGQGG